MRVIRLCSVFEPPISAITGRGAGFDPIGGMQNHTAELTRALDRRGIIQTVVTTRPPSAPRLERLGDRTRIIRLGLPIRRLRQFYSIPSAVLVPALAARANLVHVHLGEDLAVLPIGAAAARINRLPLVLTVHCSLRHTLGVTDLRSMILKNIGGLIEKRGERSAEAVITLTPRLARLLLSEGVDPGRVHVIPSGVNSVLFSGPFNDPFPKISKPRVVYVGRLALQKGVRTLVEAVPLLQSLSVRVVLVGDGPERPVLEALVGELGLKNRIFFSGFVPHEEVPGILAHADVLVLPSVYEELGSVLLEAMQVGLPIVASRTGGIPDAIIDEVNGLLVPPGHPKALAWALDRILTEPGLARRLGSAARERARDYDWSVLADQVLEVYRRLSGGATGGRRRRMIYRSKIQAKRYNPGCKVR